MAAPKRKKPVKAGTGAQAAAERREKFILAMIENGGNQTKAAITAGFSPKSAAQQASRLLKDVKVSAEIERRRKEIIENAEKSATFTVEQILREAGRLALFDARKLFDDAGNLKPIKDLDDDTAAALAQVETDEIRVDGQSVGQTRKIKVFDKNAALEKLFKHLGLYKEDNSQKGDAAVAALIAAVQARDAGSGFPIKPA